MHLHQTLSPGGEAAFEIDNHLEFTSITTSTIVQLITLLRGDEHQYSMSSHPTRITSLLPDIITHENFQICSLGASCFTLRLHETMMIIR